MSNWRGQGGKRAKGRRGDQDPELDNTAWLAELEREAAQADDEEEDWADTLRGRRSPGPPPDELPPAPAPAPPSFAAGPAPPAPSQPAAEPSWTPPADPSPSPPDYRLLGMEPDRSGSSSWDADPATPTAASGPAPPADPPPAPASDWSSWRPKDREGFGEPGPVESPEPGRADPGEPRPGGATDRDGFWDSERPRQAEPDWRMSAPDPGQEAWRPVGADTPTGAWSQGEPVGREPDYPALFGELYRRSAAQQDPIWEAPPAVDGPGQQDPTWEAPPAAERPDQPDPVWEPPAVVDQPDQPDPVWEARAAPDGPGQRDPVWETPADDGAGQPDPPAASWPFEETTQTWEPSDRSFVWPADELPTTPTEWEPAASPSWMDDPVPPPQPPIPTAAAGLAPSAQLPPPIPEPGQTSAWSAGPVPGNGVPPPVATPPPADWAAAIPSDVPAARRGSDPAAATRTWRPDQAVDVEPAVPLGTAERPPAPASAPAPAEVAEARRKPPSEGRRARQREDGSSRSWPRVVAVISWIVLVMVVCWFYVFPWLERILPESF